MNRSSDDLQVLFNYSNNNGLRLNPNKTKVASLGPERHNNFITFNFNVVRRLIFKF